MATRTPTAGAVTVPLEKIHVPANVRELDPDHVDALAGSIALEGLLQPVLLVPASGDAAGQGFEYELAAGFHRYAAVAKLAHSGIEAVIRERDDGANDADVAAARATENINRKQLNAYEEAVAVKAIIDRGLSEDGVAQALGWPKARVTARMKLLELPESAQKLIGSGVIPLSCVDTLRSVGRVSQEVLNAVVGYIAHGNEWVVDRLHSEIGWVIGRALSELDSKAFVAYVTSVDGYEVAQLKLGKKAEAQLAEIVELHKKVNPHSYGAPPIRFEDSDIDQARAAGVLIEAGGVPIIVDRPLYRELAKQALKRTVEDLRVKAAEVAEQRKTEKAIEREARAADPVAGERREHGRQMREFAAQAHGANLDLGCALRNELSTVDPTDVNVARFFVYALLGSDYSGSAYGNAGERVVQLAMTGIRLVIDEFRTDVTTTRKDGSRGALRISYGEPHKPEQPVEWMWGFIDRARTAGELYGRALVVIAAQQYASRLVVPSSQQHTPLRWYSHEDRATKALAKLAGPHLPASLKQLERAIAKAKAEHDKQVAAVRPERRDASPAANDDVDLDGVGDIDSYGEESTELAVDDLDEGESDDALATDPELAEPDPAL